MTWRSRRSYWVVMTDWDYSDGRHEPGSVYAGKCWRCGDVIGVALPCSLSVVPLCLNGFAGHHKRCKQSELGARWELIVTLRMRRRTLERALSAVLAELRSDVAALRTHSLSRAELSADLTQVLAWETDGGMTT